MTAGNEETRSGKASAKVPFSTQVSPELKAAVTATVHGLRAEVDPRTTVSGFTESALYAAVRAAEDQHHDNRPWPTRRLPPGRPRVVDPLEVSPDSTESPPTPPAQPSAGAPPARPAGGRPGEGRAQ